jgi:hypothetical protein
MVIYLGDIPGYMKIFNCFCPVPPGLKGMKLIHHQVSKFLHFVQNWLENVLSTGKGGSEDWRKKETIGFQCLIGPIGKLLWDISTSLICINYSSDLLWENTKVFPQDRSFSKGGEENLCF